MKIKKYQSVLLTSAVKEFEFIARNVASHVDVMQEKVYPQPNVYLTTHLVCMWTAGWKDTDFDTLTTVSGASALFAYKDYNDFMPKYANLYIGMDKRIADAAGFGWEWIPFEDPETGWELIKQSIDSGKPVKGWNEENLVFAGYSDSRFKHLRKVYVMSDGAGYYSTWIRWKSFCRWTKEWSHGKLGRFNGRLSPRPEKDIAIQVITDLVNWSEKPPEKVIQQFPGTKFGLEGMKAYAADCKNMDKYKTWSACHPINPQWIVRNSTAVYLENLIKKEIFRGDINNYLIPAAGKYRAAYSAWREFYNILGYSAPRTAGRTKHNRKKGAESVRKAIEHEKEALGLLSKALDLIRQDNY